MFCVRLTTTVAYQHAGAEPLVRLHIMCTAAALCAAASTHPYRKSGAPSVNRAGMRLMRNWNELHVVT
jgi:hypothetical protein